MLRVFRLFICFLSVALFSCTVSRHSGERDAYARIPNQVSDVDFTYSTANALKDVSQLVTPKSEEVYYLSNARIVIADYDLIKKDFPELSHFSNVEIDEWILQNTAYIAKPQAHQTVVNNEIPVDVQKTVHALRPQNYNRALVYETNQAHPNRHDVKVSGLIDVKGAGTLNPAQADHANGLMSLGEAMKEYIYENMLRDTFQSTQSGKKTIGSYAVIDAGFRVKHADGSSSPAGLYLRQASARGGREVPVDLYFKQTLKHLGVMAELSNIQLTDDGSLIDFGHYYVSPDLNGILPFDVWGYDPKISIPKKSWARSRFDYPWIWSHEFAEAWARGEVNRDVAYRHFLNFIEPARKVIFSPSGSCSDVFSKLLQ